MKIGLFYFNLVFKFEDHDGLVGAGPDIVKHVMVSHSRQGRQLLKKMGGLFYFNLFSI